MGEGDYGIEMGEGEIAEFLTRRGHGVLSFGGERPYGIPLSFGYDDANDRCIFQLLSDPDSKKQAFITESEEVTLTVYEWVSVDDWRSVVISGRLVEIESGTPDAADAAGVFAEYGAVVGLSVFNRPAEELVSQWYELRITEILGYQSPLVE